MGNKWLERAMEWQRELLTDAAGESSNIRRCGYLFPIPHSQFKPKLPTHSAKFP